MKINRRTLLTSITFFLFSPQKAIAQLDFELTNVFVIFGKARKPNDLLYDVFQFEDSGSLEFEVLSDVARWGSRKETVAPPTPKQELQFQQLSNPKQLSFPLAIFLMFFQLFNLSIGLKLSNAIIIFFWMLSNIVLILVFMTNLNFIWFWLTLLLTVIVISIASLLRYIN